MITSVDSRVLDANAEALGIPVADLMDNAGTAVSSFLKNSYPEGRGVFVCGPGNNGGDGFAAALRMDPDKVKVALLKKPSSIHTDAARERYSLLECPTEAYSADSLKDVDYIVDCALGTGISGDVRDPYRQFILDANDSGKPIISVDVPSGLNSDLIIEPDMTVTFHDVKDGMDESNSGRIFVADIGIPKEAYTDVGPGDVLRYPIPDSNSHKGMNGRLMIVAGGPYFGAPVMAATAALRTGADIVRIFTPESAANAVSTYNPVLMVTPLPGDFLTEESVRKLLSETKNYDAVLIGPGLGKDPETMDAVRSFVSSCRIPVVVDADGLSAVKGMWLPTGSVITPHRGEYVELGGTVPESLASAMNTVVLLKGHDDLITDGKMTRTNHAGTAAMTGAGTGDVLAGTVAALLAKGLSAMDSASLGAYLCGKAGELAFEDKSYGLIATDVAERIPCVLRKYLG